MLANGLGDRGSIPSRAIPKILCGGVKPSKGGSWVWHQTVSSGEALVLKC